MNSCLHLSASTRRTDQSPDPAHDVTFSESLVEAFLDEFTEAGDVVLDPFAGFGTTLVVAERMNRVGVGIELLPDRADFIRRRMGSSRGRVITGDTRHLSELNIGPVDFVLTSPPYMTVANHPQNPLTGYQTLDGDYANYLQDLTAVFEQVTTVLRPQGRVVVNVANIAAGGTEVTTLAWDVGRALSSVLRLEQDVVVCWDVLPPGLTQDYCLVFRLPKPVELVAS